jgi:hypothetical protein
MARNLTAKLSEYLPVAALSIPFYYHGLWNLGPEGENWWVQHAHFPAWLRSGVGLLELLTATGVWFLPVRRISAGLISILMMGAVFEHFSAGYSFKNIGYETPLAYFLIAASLVFNTELKTSSEGEL